MKKKKRLVVRIIAFALVVSMIIPLFFAYVSAKEKEPESISYATFKEYFESKEIDSIYYNEDAIDMLVVLKSGEEFIAPYPSQDPFKQSMIENGVNILPYKEKPDVKEKIEKTQNTSRIISTLVWIVCIFSMFAFFHNISKRNKMMMQAYSNIANGQTSANTNKENIKNPNIKTFDDVAGLKETKRDLLTIVDFLKNKEKYESAGAKLPRGVILYGPPGTGKTLLAKAVAGEAGVNFLFASASDFTEMYVGVGPKRVRELFEKARKNAPCIVFIDELDAICTKRGMGEHSEDKKTLIALLTEMDGFKENPENVIIIGATNRIETLDDALLRPGRFTNKYCVPLPENAEERLEVINLYNKNKKFDETVNFESLAKELVGFSPASIEKVLNEAAIISVRKKVPAISKKIIDEAIMNELVEGHVRDDQSGRSKEELEIVAWHEAGHALVGKLKGKNISKVTILSTTSGAGGVTFSSPKKEHLLSKQDLVDEIMELYAGRVGELALLGEEDLVTTGASNDFERASGIVERIVKKYGMTKEFGPLVLSNEEEKENVFNMKVTIAKEIYEDTKTFVKRHLDKLEKIANLLLEKETIYEKELDDIFST